MMSHDDRRSSPLWIGEDPHSGGRADIQVAWAGYAPNQRKRTQRTPTNIDCYLIVEGEGSVRFDEGPAQAIVPGCWFVTRPGITVDYGPHVSGQWAEYGLALRGSGAHRLFDWGWLPHGDSVHVLSRTDQAISSWQRLIQLIQDADPWGADRALVAAFETILSCRQATETEDINASSGDKTIQLILRWMKDHLAQDIDFEALALRFAMSYSSFRQRCRAHTGYPPQQLLTRLRCERARQLLLRTELPISTIAREVGLPRLSTFSHTFTRIVGVSPSQFRQDGG